MFDLAMQALAGLVKEWDRQRAVAAFGKLNDRLLADIGLRRDQLPTYLMDEKNEDISAFSRRHAFRPELLTCG